MRSSRDAHAGRARSWAVPRRHHDRGRGARLQRGPSGGAVRRRRGQAAGHAPGPNRPGTLRRLHHQRAQVPPATEPRPDAERGRVMLGLPGSASVDDQAEGRARARAPRAGATTARPGFDLAHTWQPRAPRRGGLCAAVSPGRRPAQRSTGRGPRARLRSRQGIPRQAPCAPRPSPRPSPRKGEGETGSRTAAPVVNKSRLRDLPLGGLGEVGINMWALEWENQVLGVDAGLMFPQDEMLGIDLVLPDISYLLEKGRKVLGIFLSHGHEDHIGRRAYALEKLNLPVYGPRLTPGFVEPKLKEHRILREDDRREAQGGDTVTGVPY